MTEKVAVKTGIDEIRFGHAGGFSGKVNTYILSADGNLSEQGTGIGLLKKVDYKTTLAIFLDAREISTISLSEPDNVYSFVEIKTQKSTNRIVWSFGSTRVSENVLRLYKKLISLTKESPSHE
jgi:hypothetical protein